MVECEKCLDPTALGLFLVAVVSLPLAILQFYNEGIPTRPFFELMGLLIILVACYAYKSDSNFGFTVFMIVGAAVALTGFEADPSFNGSAINWENVAFALVFFLAIIWSVVAKTPKALSGICLTTGLIFLTVGLSGVIGGDYWHWLIGISALANFLLNIYLSFALALEGKIPIL